MEYVNALQKYEASENKNIKFFKACVDDLVRMLAPFAPHFSEELWEILGHRESVFAESYPAVDEKASRSGRNGIRRATQQQDPRENDDRQRSLERGDSSAVCANPEIAALVAGKEVKKCIVVPGRLVNLIVG